MVLLLLNIGLATYAQQDRIEVPVTEIIIYSDDFEMVVQDLECIGGWTAFINMLYWSKCYS